MATMACGAGIVAAFLTAHTLLLYGLQHRMCVECLHTFDLLFGYAVM